MEESDEGLIRFLMRDRHGSPFEHNAFRFHIRCPIFVAREWFRHRIGCLTGDTEVTFVDVNGHAHMRKTIDEIVHMWRRRARASMRSTRHVRVAAAGESAVDRELGSAATFGVSRGARPRMRDGSRMRAFSTR